MLSSPTVARDVESRADRREHLPPPAAASRGATTNGPDRGSDSRHRFSATVRLSQNASSWCTMPIPAASASAGAANVTDAADDLESPASGA